MTERTASGEQNSREYIELVRSTLKAIRNLNPDSIPDLDYESSERTVLGFDYDESGPEIEASISINFYGETLDEEIVYEIKGGKIKKTGFVDPALVDGSNPIHYGNEEYDDEFHLEEHGPEYICKPSLRVGIEELGLLNRLAKNPIETIDLIDSTLPHLPRK